MKCISFNRNLFFLMWFTALLVLIPNIVFSQALISGKVINKKTAEYAAYATIEIMKHKGITEADKYGFFSIVIEKTEPNDTVIISSIGYKTLKLPVSEAAKLSVFELIEDAKKLETVILKSFSRRTIKGSTSDNVGYYRSWNIKGNDGEIGRFFMLPYDEYQIDKLEFKVINWCDTCLIRLHIRNVENGMPKEDILYDTSAAKKGITVFVKNFNTEKAIHEFDLSSYNLITDWQIIFVALEVVNCKVDFKSDCSFSFAGSEKGKYLYKSGGTSNWTISADDFTVYMKLYISY